ncbi:MAG: NADH-quinone oxidoreductase subunit L [Actinobacteria bacterium]|nr:NADH-quinone oxidoreductase subunit L [Actinomycetota bacterium]
MAWLLLLVPGAGAVGLCALRGHRGALLAASVGAMAATLVVGTWAAAAQPAASWRWGGGIVLTLAVEGLARVMVVLVPAIALPVVAYGAATMRHDPGLARLLALLCAFVAAMLVLVAAADLLTLLVGWELVGATSWALITHHWRDPDHPRLAGHAFLTTRAGDVGLVAAAAVTLGVAGTTDYAVLGSLRGWPAHVAGAGLLVAAAAKSAQLPFSPWLFSAMAGPTPVSALLHSATMVAAGAYALARIVPLLAGAMWLAAAVAALGAATAVAGGVVAAAQTDLKRALAASTSAQYGLVLVAVGAGSTAAAGAHLVNHALFKSLLFLGAGVALHVAGTLELGELRLGRVLPFTSTAFAVGALALAAVPPLGAARSKEEVLAASFHAGPWLGAAVVVAGFLSALYAGRLAVLSFGPGRPRGTRRGGAGPVERVALGALAVATVALAVLWLPGAGAMVEAAAGGRLFEASAWELPLSLAALAAAAGVLALLARRGRLVTLGLPPRLHSVLGSWVGLPGLARHAVVDPVLWVSATLAAFDDRVVDAGVRAAARVPVALSRAASWWGEPSLDGVVRALSGSTLRAGVLSRRFDEGGVDRAVEDLARGAGMAGRRSRRLQSGLAHQYYVIVAVGLAATVAVAALGR